MATTTEAAAAAAALCHGCEPQHEQHAEAAAAAEDDEECCWICLSSERRDLVHPCSCPRVAHRACIAHWQLVSAGKE